MSWLWTSRVAALLLVSASARADPAPLAPAPLAPAPLAPAPLAPAPLEAPPPPDLSAIGSPIPLVMADSVPPPPTSPCPSGVAFRVAAAGAIRELYDLTAYEGGGALAIGGGKCQEWEAFLEARYLQGTTAGGLNVREITLRETFEIDLQKTGIRLGAGGDIPYFGIQRATTGAWLQDVGIGGHLRLAYDSGLPLRPFASLDLDLQFQTATIWGPTLAVGIRL